MAHCSSHFSYDYNDEHKFFNYASPNPYCYDDHGSTVCYSVSTTSVPKLLQHNHALTQLAVSYSTAEFNEPEYEEYDPTPDGGRYDPGATYGKPCPPSDQTCYRGSTTDPAAPPLDGATSHGFIPSPAKEEIEGPVAVPKKPHGKTDHKEDVDSKKGEPMKECDEDENGSGYYNPWVLNGSAFGYCPCACHAHSRGGYRRGESQPSWCANYIFGCSAYPYGQGREFGGSYPNPIFGYERHYQGQSLQGQVQYEDPLLLNISTNFF